MEECERSRPTVFRSAPLGFTRRFSQIGVSVTVDVVIVVVAVDLSEASRSVFDAALDLAHNAPDSHLHLLHVRKGDRASADPIDLAKWAERLPEREGIELHAVESTNVPQAIVRFAASIDADLILLGTHGRTGVSRVLLGSVAEEVTRTAGCSVFIVRPKSHAR
jgi:nucleotide-binding universal stress UspA family protein